MIKMRLVAIILLFILPGMAFSQITYETVRVDYDSVWEYKNLRIYPVRGLGAAGEMFSNVITLQEALATGEATVSERGSASTTDVHWVKIKNHGNKPIYVGSGEMLIGGRQDRVLVKDTILLPTGEEQLIPSMCIEQGRWSRKEKKFEYNGYVNPRLRKLLDKSGNQSLVWGEIYSQLKSNKVQSPTLAYIAQKQNEEYILESNGYLNYFRNKLLKDSSIVGIVCLSGDEVIGTDIYVSQRLFLSQAIELIAGYTEEAITGGKAVTVPLEEVINYMDKLLTNEYSQELFCKKNGMIHKIGGEVVHVTGYSNKEEK